MSGGGIEVQEAEADVTSSNLNERAATLEDVELGEYRCEDETMLQAAAIAMAPSFDENDIPENENDSAENDSNDGDKKPQCRDEQPAATASTATTETTAGNVPCDISKASLSRIIASLRPGAYHIDHPDQQLNLHQSDSSITSNSFCEGESIATDEGNHDSDEHEECQYIYDPKDGNIIIPQAVVVDESTVASVDESRQQQIIVEATRVEVSVLESQNKKQDEETAAKKRRRRRQICFAVLCGLLIMIALAVGLAVAVTNNRRKQAPLHNSGGPYGGSSPPPPPFNSTYSNPYNATTTGKYGYKYAGSKSYYQYIDGVYHLNFTTNSSSP